MHWSNRGVQQRVFEMVVTDADNERYLIHPVIVRAHQHSSGTKKSDPNHECVALCRGCVMTKSHATFGALRNATSFHLSLGQAHDLECLLRCWRPFQLDPGFLAGRQSLPRKGKTFESPGSVPVLPVTTAYSKVKSFDSVS